MGPGKEPVHVGGPEFPLIKWVSVSDPLAFVERPCFIFQSYIRIIHFLFIKNIQMCVVCGVYVCVCMCVRERQTETTETEKGDIQLF